MAAEDPLVEELEDRLVHDATHTARRTSGWRILTTLFGVAVLGVTFLVVLPRVADYGKVWQVITDMSPGWTAVLVLATVVNLATYAPTWMVAVPGLRYLPASELSLSSTAVSNVIPAGGAAGFGTSYAILREWRVDNGTIAVAVVVTGVWNQLVNISLPVLAVVLLSLRGTPNPTLQSAAVIGVLAFAVVVVLLVLVLHSDDQARRIGAVAGRAGSALLRVVRRGPLEHLDERFVAFRNDSLDLLRTRWLWLTLAVYGGTLTVFVVLVVCLRATGVGAGDIDLTEAFAAWALVRVLTAIPITPGNLGVQELGLSGMLIGFGTSETAIVAAVLLFRVMTTVPLLVVGGISTLTWRRHEPADVRRPRETASR